MENEQRIVRIENVPFNINRWTDEELLGFHTYLMDSRQEVDVTLKMVEREMGDRIDIDWDGFASTSE